MLDRRTGGKILIGIPLFAMLREVQPQVFLEFIHANLHEQCQGFHDENGHEYGKETTDSHADKLAGKLCGISIQ